MKKFLMMALTCLFMSGLQANSKVYLKNNYGGEIVYNLNDKDGLRLNANSTIDLGSIDSVERIEIRASGMGSFASFGMASYTSLLGQIEYIRKMNIQDAAVLSINYDNNTVEAADKSIVGGWHISVDWPGVRKMYNESPQNRIKLMGAGLFGPHVKSFVEKICIKSDYLEAVKNGKTDLCKYLRESLNNTPYASLNSLIMRIEKLYSSMQSFGYIKTK